MKRWLFNFAAGLSLLLFLLMMILWIRSFWIADYLSCAQTGPRIAIWSHRGRMVMDWVNYEKAPVWPGFGNWQWERTDHKDPIPLIDTDPSRSAKWWWLGFNYRHAILLFASHVPVVSQVVLAIPDWALAGILAIVPAVWYARHRRRRYRREHELCPVCGYDLRATPERCPECGTISTAAKGAAT